MQIAQRAFNVVRSAVSSVLHRAEDKQINERATQAASNAEAASDQLNQATAEAIANLKARERDLLAERKELQTYLNRAELCVKSSDPEIQGQAKDWALKAASSEKRIADLEAKYAEINSRVSDYRDRARDASLKAGESKDKAQDIIADNRFADAERNVQKKIDGIAGSGSDDTLDKLQEKVQGKLDTNKALDEISGKKADRDIAKLERDAAAEAILNRFKPAPAPAPTPIPPAADANDGFNIAK